MTKPAECIHHSVTQWGSIWPQLGIFCGTFLLISKCNSPGPQPQAGVQWKSCELRAAGIVKGYLLAGDESWRYMYCCCLSPAVKFMAHIKAPHHVADRQYIFSRTGDHDSWCLVKLQLRSLWITVRGICLHVGRRPQSFGPGVEYQSPCVFVFLLPDPSPLQPSL